ncbi:glycosyl transferase family 1 [Jatrophihabitans sp. GAS493]|uniref:glycosyltransferase family 4 protein n=1 Tax=Jatrophihabitans sp. GAS493 TaxID=1907575 RepID=UPI000BB93EB2|nr:glycosyltransferase family 4 protein [Jatrophihabitans sp. GAS493]SOD70297.1 glycosyl transferase family 1 [Jatrophihabitans sp. GAS493]
MLRVGFACAWDPQPEATWSHTPWQLREGMRSECDIVDIDLTYPEPARLALKAAYARRRDGKLVSLWKHTRPARLLNSSRLTRADEANRQSRPLDAILQIGDLGPTRTPYFFLQDLSYDLLLDLEQADKGVQMQFSSLSLATIRRLRDRQRRLYETSHGVIALSQWLASHLVTTSGVPAEKVHVVHPGATAAKTPVDLSAVTARRLAGRRSRLLFVGRNFERKGGVQVLQALKILRDGERADVTLTIAGPKAWPLSGEPPAGVTFLGPVSNEEVARLVDEHDLFVLPSQFEAFGIVFVEALSRGLPCVGRDAFAMPEIIQPGRNGALVTSDSADELADLITSALDDDELIRRTSAAADESRAYYSWSRAGRQVVEIMGAATS